MKTNGVEKIISATRNTKKSEQNEERAILQLNFS